MKLIIFKLMQTLTILASWALFSAIAAIGAPLFLLWSSCSLLADVWTFEPKKDRHA